MANTQRELREADCDQNKTKKWLRSTGLKAETKGLIIEAQDQSLTKRSYHARIIKDGTNLICRICKENKRQNTETKIGYQRNGRKKHSMANTQRELREADCDQNKTKKWLRSTGLKAETKGLIIEAQDQSLTKRSYHARIIKDGTNLICRICNRYEETIDHIVSSCPELEYIQRHNKVAACLHCKTCQHYNIQVLD